MITPLGKAYHYTTEDGKYAGFRVDHGTVELANKACDGCGSSGPVLEFNCSEWEYAGLCFCVGCMSSMTNIVNMRGHGL